jgi:hypothetical protein
MQIISDVIQLGPHYSIDQYVKELVSGAKKPWGDLKVRQLVSDMNTFIERRTHCADCALKIYASILSKSSCKDDDTAAVTDLKLSGLVTVSARRTLVARNRIYRSLFNRQWIMERQSTVQAQKGSVALTPEQEAQEVV